MSFVSVKNLTKSFDNTKVFADISFDIEEGEFITLLGPSGCGKSTLLRCIAGLNSVNSGNVFVSGEEITYLPPQKRGIGMVFQSYALFPNLTAFDNIAFGLKLKKLPENEIKTRVNQVIDLVDLHGRENYYLDELSGGQRQRVALARALVVRPRILFLDEPLSALDAKIRKRLRYMIRKIQKDLNLTTIFVTHDQEEAMVMSDRIFLMHQGKIIQSGAPDEVYSHPINEFAAGFMGNYNILDASFAKNWLNLEVPYKVAIRPESIFIDEKPNGVRCANDMPLRGTIKFTQLLGNVIRYTVESDGKDLTVDLLNSAAVKPIKEGQVVNLFFNADEINVIGA